MSPASTIEFQISGPALAVLARVQNRAGVLGSVARELDRQNELTVSHIQRKYLSFPFTKRIAGRIEKQPTTLEGLRVRTGLLRRSIRRTNAIVAGDTVTAAIGSNVKYAGIHEFGGRIQMPARARRMNFIENRFVSREAFVLHLKKFEGARRIIAYGRPYTINMPARSYLRRGIADRKDLTGAAVGRAIVNFAEGKGPVA